MSGSSKKRQAGGRKNVDALARLEAIGDEFDTARRDDREDDKLRERLETVEKSYAAVESLLDVSASITSTLNLTELLENIVDSILRLTGCQRGFLMLKNNDGGLTLEIARVKGQHEWKEAELEISQSIVREVAAKMEPIYSSNVLKKKDVKVTDSMHLFNINTVICLPLDVDGALVGVIYADSQFVSDSFLDSNLKVMRAFAALAAVAINNARRHGELSFQRQNLEEQNVSLRHKLGQEFASYGMITNNKKMEEIFEAVNKIAPSDFPVIIQGESGTGKELLARAVHEKSSRKNQRFEPVNCAAIPPGLVESTLFGHRRGAYTGASEDRAGVFELADKGTLFLDEIGDMPLDAQAKILRVIQDGEVRRIGEEKSRKVNVRIIVATHIDLARAVKDGRFRSDLYFRLKVAQFDLPPLRERREDILPLAESFLKKYAEDKNKPLPKLHRDAKEFLLRNPWVGNVRVLKSAVEWGIVFQDENNWIRAKELEKFFNKDDDLLDDDGNDTLKVKLHRYEEQLIRKTLTKYSDNITTTAKALGISRQQLHNKIKKYKLNHKGE